MQNNFFKFHDRQKNLLFCPICFQTFETNMFYSSKLPDHPCDLNILRDSKSVKIIKTNEKYTSLFSTKYYKFQ